MTNNEAEYQTLTGALARLAERVADPRRVAVEVFGDSQLVIRQLEGAWKVRTPSIKPFRDAAAAELARFGAVKLTWQRRDKSVALLGH
ncbi:MAG: reverse transcriptase-like protein [Anaerolineae bacterium]